MEHHAFHKILLYIILYSSPLRMEHHANLLWIPLASPYNTNQVSNLFLPSDPQSSNQFNPNQDQLSIIFPFDQAWLDTHFKNKDRIEVVIFKASNVLTPKALQEVTIKSKSLRNKTSQNSFPFLRCSHCTRRYRALKLRGNSLRTFAQGEFSIHPFIS